MALEKLTIEVETVGKDFTEPAIVRALFNPQTVTYSKVAWNRIDNDPQSLAIADDPTLLDIELFFDTTIPDKILAFKYDSCQPSESGDTEKPTVWIPEDVRSYTQPIFDLSKKQKWRPPRCRLVWGTQELLPMGILLTIAQKFVHFWPDGTPVRAILTCRFQEFPVPPDDSEDGKKKSGSSNTTHTVAPGETLSRIAKQEYGDASKWKAIAQANGIVNPRSLEVGQVLTLP